MDTSKLCRSCMKEVASWERENFDVQSIEMFCFCTNLKITEDDKLPRQFCYDCVIKIESAYTYVIEAQKVDAILKNVISRTNTSIIIEPDTYKNVDKFTYIDHNIKDEPVCEKTISNPDNSLLDNMKNKIDGCALEEKGQNVEVLVEMNETANVRETKQHICCLCRKVFTSKLWFSKHMNKEHNVKHKSICEKTRESLIDNLNNKTNDCVDVDEKEHNIEIKALGKQIVNVEDNKKQICPVCRKAFTSKLWFSKHMKKEHNGPKFVCEHCQKTFSRKWELSQHSLCHSAERKFSCASCGARFKRRNQLAAHARAHNDARPFECAHCAMKFKFKSVLKSHLKVHAGDKQYLCSFCGWSFAQAGNLEAHIRKHTGDKPYSCEECGFRAAFGSSLKRHQRRHRRARPYVCEQCHKAFYDSSGLLRHTRIHSGELPFQCPGCTRAFVDSWKRKAHLMSAHRMALHAIPRMRRDGRPL